jgi:GTP-binding protein EngB required for normal cell division
VRHLESHKEKVEMHHLNYLHDRQQTLALMCEVIEKETLKDQMNNQMVQVLSLEETPRAKVQKLHNN